MSTLNPVPRFDNHAAGSNEIVLRCPRCGDLYMHHGRVTVYDRGEDETHVLKTTVSDTEPKLDVAKVPHLGSGNPSYRRHGVAIFFQCEHCDFPDPDTANVEDWGKGVELTITQHKGNTLLRWREA